MDSSSLVCDSFFFEDRGLAFVAVLLLQNQRVPFDREFHGIVHDRFQRMPELDGVTERGASDAIHEKLLHRLIDWNLAQLQRIEDSFLPLFTFAPGGQSEDKADDRASPRHVSILSCQTERRTCFSSAP